MLTTWPVISTAPHHRTTGLAQGNLPKAASWGRRPGARSTGTRQAYRPLWSGTADGRDEAKPLTDSRGAAETAAVEDRSTRLGDGVPLFHQAWWLDAVAPRRWSVVEVCRGGEVVARMPFVVRGPRRLRVLTQPPLTQFLGPWVSAEPGAKPATALGDEMRLQAELEAALPAAAAFRQNFSPTMIGALPFVWAGYRSEVRYTYRQEDLSSAGVADGLAGNIRANIRKAQRRVTVRTDLGLDRLQAVWAKTFSRQGLPAPTTAPLSGSRPPARHGTRGPCCSR